MEHKKQKYEILLSQLEALIDGESDATAIMANAAALLQTEFRWWWTGFYRVEGEELLLGPFQGPVACVHIGYGKGVCGTAWKEDKTQVVPDVELFPGHIACSSLSRSEIVVPLRDDAGHVRAVLDIDSKDLNAFDETDAFFLEKVSKIISKQIYN